jgi:hypothetical protein
MVTCAVKKRPVTGRYKGINKQGYVAGGARIAVLPNANANTLCGFIRTDVRLGTQIISDGLQRLPTVGRLLPQSDCTGY